MRAVRRKGGSGARERRDARGRSLVLLACLAAALGAAACRHAPEPEAKASASAADSIPLPPRAQEGGYTDVTLAAGVRVEHRLPTSDIANIVDSLGAGASFADLDGDGWLDLVVPGGPSSPAGGDWPEARSGIRLYQNLGDGRFRDVTDRSGVPADVTAIAVAVADVDGDGDRDLYLLDRGPNRLYRNHDGVFEEVPGAGGAADPAFSVGAAFFDMDGDGDLDLYVTNYLDFDPRQTAYFAPDGFPGPLSYPAEADTVYENLGDGRFVDVSAEAGVLDLRGRGMSVAAADFDEDGDTDLFVANDGTANFLLLNDGAGHFVEAAAGAGVAMGENGEQTGAMAADIGDVDGDGSPDLAVSDTAYGALYRRVGPALFTDDVMRSGLGPLCGQYVSWGQNLLDYDNDGDLDLFVVNADLHHLVGWEDLLLANRGGGSFEDVSSVAGTYFASRQVGRSSIVGDYDNDGDLDLFVTSVGGRHFLLRNDSPPSAAWITLDLVGARGRDPFGARVEIRSGEAAWAAELRFPTAFLGQSDPRIHFGLGRQTTGPVQVRVVWPEGREEILPELAPGEIHEIREGGV